MMLASLPQVGVRRRVCIAVVVALVAMAGRASAQSEPTAEPPMLKVENVLCAAEEGASPRQPSSAVPALKGEGVCELKRELSVVLEAASVQKWVDSKRSLASLVLVINGLPFEGQQGRIPAANEGFVQYQLNPQSDADQWKTLYAGQDERATFDVALGIREPGTVPAATAEFNLVSNAQKANFRIRPTYREWIYISLGALVALLVYLGRVSNLLRDSGDTGDFRLRPYSLARTQLALWTVGIVGSYLFIWAVLGNTNPLNDTALILMGLSALTGLASTIADQPANPPASDPAAGGGAQPQPQPPPQPPPTDPAVSVGFFRDILSDDQGVSIYRVQMAVWTLVLFVVFIYTVWSTLAMPTFSPMLLGLMGISNGAYVTLKTLQ